MLAILFVLSLSALQPADDPFVIDEPDPTPQAQRAVEPQATRAADAATPAPSRERLICRSRPQLGSRVVAQRVCKTAEDWAIYENDLEQSRRDIAAGGSSGCDMRYTEEC